MMMQKLRRPAPFQRPLMTIAGAFLAIATTVVTPGAANAAKETALNDAQIATVKKVGDYFNKVTDLQGDFIQLGPRGHISQGVFYLNKPGKLRFEYSPPNPFLIVSDGDWVIINNRKKNKADYYPLSSTPLRLVLEGQIDLLDEARIIHVQEDTENLSVTLEDKSQLVAGQLTVVFDPRTMQLRQWIVIDGQGLRTTITLQGLKGGIKADPKLFVVQRRNEIPDINR